LNGLGKPVSAAAGFILTSLRKAILSQGDTAKLCPLRKVGKYMARKDLARY
jgi:hypothetical protein